MMEDNHGTNTDNYSAHGGGGGCPLSFPAITKKTRSRKPQQH